MDRKQEQYTAGLIPKYQTYNRQKCFIAYTKQAEWSEDLLDAIQKVLSRSKFGLEIDYADKHFDPDVPLQRKVLDLIANARYGIYDLSYWPDRGSKDSQWHVPGNVFIELGMAIALNRPTLLLRHQSNRLLELPECLKSVSDHILEFGGETTLKRELEKQLPHWINTPPEQDWWSRLCIFGGRRFEYSVKQPHSKQWTGKPLYCNILAGSDDASEDFRGVVEEVLDRFTDITYTYLDSPPMTEDYEFLLCSYCQTLRSSLFAIYQISEITRPETFVSIGMNIGLGKQFGYNTLKIILTEDLRNIPSLLSGYEVVLARNDRQRKVSLSGFMPMVMKKARQTLIRPQILPFVDTTMPITEISDELEANSPLETKGKSRTEEYLSMPVAELGFSTRVQNAFRAAEIRTVRDIVLRTEHELLRYRDFGQSSLRQVKSVLALMGLSLGMNFDDSSHQERESITEGEQTEVEVDQDIVTEETSQQDEPIIWPRKSEVSFEIRSQDEVDVVDVTGILDAFTTPEIKDELKKLTDARRYRLVLNFAEVTYVNSTAAGAIVAVVQYVRRRKGDLKLFGMKTDVRKFFDLVGASKIMDIFETEEYNYPQKLDRGLRWIFCT